MVALDDASHPPKGASALSATLIPHSSSSLTSRKHKPSSLFPQETRSGRISTALVFRNASKRDSRKSKLQEQGESRLQGPLGSTPVYTGVTLMVHEIPHWSRQQPQSWQSHLRSAVETAKGQRQMGRSSSRREWQTGTSIFVTSLNPSITV